MIVYSYITLFAIASTIPLSSACPNGWTTFEGHCYHFVDTKQTWFHADKLCRNNGAQLVSVQDDKESTFLKQTIRHMHSHEDPQTIGYWTAGNDLEVEGHWEWGYPGHAALTYTDWFPPNPNNEWYDHRPKDCIVIWGHDHHNFQWNDQPCDIEDYYVCERPPEDCIVIWGHDHHNFQWNDQPCDIEDYYVCERP